MLPNKHNATFKLSYYLGDHSSCRNAQSEMADQIPTTVRGNKNSTDFYFYSTVFYFFWKLLLEQIICLTLTLNSFLLRHTNPLHVPLQCILTSSEVFLFLLPYTSKIILSPIYLLSLLCPCHLNHGSLTLSPKCSMWALSLIYLFLINPTHI